MDKLSVEILSSIFTYLHYEQKKHCMLVCQSWAQVIRSDGLKLETMMNPLVVRSYTSQPTLASIQSNPETVGCHRLALDQYHNKAKLAKLFPNMRFLVFYPGREVCTHPSYTVHASGVVPVEYTDEETELLTRWHHRLETLIDYDFTNELFVLLDSGVFHQLTTIMVKPDYNFPRDIPMADLFFECLKNTPNLKVIDLKVGRFNTTHLEKLHSYVPYLETLRFDYFSYTTGPGEESLEIKSKATSLKTLEVRYPYDFPTVLARYILAKYPNLQEFNCNNSPRNYNEMKIFLPQFLQATETTLKKFKIDAPKIVSSITTFLQENPYLSLTTLELVICDHPPDPIYSIGYQGQERVVIPNRVSEQGEDNEEKEKEVFDLVKWVENSNITSLSLINIPNINLGVFNTLDKLKDLRLKFLASLRVSAELNSVIIELPKSLESLSLSSVDVYLEEEEKKDWQFISGIKRLELLGCRANSDLSEYLSNQLPLLKTFIHHTDRLIFDLRLRHSHLSLVDIAIDFRNPATIEEALAPKEKVPCKHIKVTMRNKTHIFRHAIFPEITFKSRLRFGAGLFNVHDHSLHDVFIPFDGPVKDTTPYFHFQCKSIQTLLYDRILVFV